MITSNNLEKTIIKMFKHRTTTSLKRTLETKKGNIDDETYEFARRMKLQGKEWKFNDSLFNPRIITWEK